MFFKDHWENRGSYVLLGSEAAFPHRKHQKVLPAASLTLIEDSFCCDASLNGGLNSCFFIKHPSDAEDSNYVAPVCASAVLLAFCWKILFSRPFDHFRRFSLDPGISVHPLRV